MIIFYTTEKLAKYKNITKPVVIIALELNKRWIEKIHQENF